MTLNDIHNIEELKIQLNAYVLKLKNTTEFSENCLKDAVKIIDSLCMNEISFLCEPEILSHELFTKFRLCYYAQLNTWRRGLILSDYGRQVLLKLGRLFNTLTEHITNANIDILERLLFDKKLIEELSICLTDLVYRIDDPDIESIGHLILSLRLIQTSRRILKNNSLQEKLVNAIIECLTTPWYEMCLCEEMTDPQRIVFGACIDYILDDIDEHVLYNYDKIFTPLITKFPQWLYEQAKNSSILTWNEQIILIIYKLISIMMDQIWKFNNEIDENHIDLYQKLVEALLTIFSKISVNSYQIDQKKNDLTVNLLIQHLTDLSLDSHLLNIIKKKNLSQIFSYFTQSEQLEIQSHAYYLLAATLSRTELVQQIDERQLIVTVLKNLRSNSETIKTRRRLIITLSHLRQLLRYESIKEEFIKQGGLPQIEKFATCFEKDSFQLRDAALKVMHILYDCHLDPSNDVINTISEIMPGNEQKWISSTWKLHNWNSKKEGNTSITVTIPTHNFDPNKAVQAVLKHNKAVSDRNLKRVARRNREDIRLVWIFSDENDTISKTIIHHLRAIVHTVQVYADTQSSEAVKFILHNREENFFVLMHSAIEKTIVRQIQHAAHIVSIVVYGSPFSSGKISTKLQDSTLVSYENDLCRAIDLLASNVQSYRNDAFWFYESKQMMSIDLSTESAAFFWQLLLIRILHKLPSIDASDFITLAIQWYKNNPLVLCEIERFRKEYKSDTVQYWFLTKSSSFVQRMLQKAFKQVDMQIILSARFFIIDLMTSITTQHWNDHSISHIVFGELMSAKRVQFLLTNQDTLIMPKGFLICCTNREKVIDNLRSRPRHRDSIYAVLFEINKDDNSPVLLLDDGEHVMFSYDISFRVITIKFDQSLDIYRIQLKILKNNEIREQLWQRHVELRREAGEYIDDNVLFGFLLSDMNRVSAAMSYYFFHMEECSYESHLNEHRLSAIARIAVRCNNLEDADTYCTQAISLYETLVPSNNPYLIRLLLELMNIYIKSEKNEQAIQIYDRVQILLTNECNLTSSMLRYWAQGLGCFCQMRACNIQSARQMLKTYFEFYRRDRYRCAHPVLIGGLAIDIGDFVYEQNYFDISGDCYTFAFEISNRNLPFCHPMVIVSLQRLLKSVQMLSTTDKEVLSIRETKLLPLLEKSLSDINDEDNQIMADTMRDIGFGYAKLGMGRNTKSYLEKCISIYRKQCPRDEISLNQCQIYLCKQELSLNTTLLDTPYSTTTDSLHLSALYKYNHPADPIEAEEQQQLWNVAGPNYRYNRTVESKVVQRQLLVWIDANKTADNDKFLSELLTSNNHADLHIFDNVDSAIIFLANKDFQHVQIVVNSNMADTFFTKQDTAKLQSNACLTMRVFVFGIEHNEELYEKYLSYLQCSRKCWTQMPNIIERCLILSKDDSLLRQFCMMPDHLGTEIASIMFLVEVQAFGDVFLDEVDPIDHQIIHDADESNVEFVGYMSSCSLALPKLLQHLRIAKPVNFPKNHVQIATLIMFGRRHGLSSEQIASICRHFSPGCCIRPQTLLKYFVRLWSLESPPFYRLVNQSLAECDIVDVHLLRFIVYDYFELFNTKLLPYFVGTLYRGIQTSEDNIATLLSLVGEQIYCVCFTSTSKNLARAMVGGNVLFIIQTLSKEKQEECRTQTNVDISTVSQFPEEEEVIYAPLTKFLLLDVTYINDPNESVQYIIKLYEQASSLFTQFFMDKVGLPNGTPFQSGTDMWQYRR